MNPLLRPVITGLFCWIAIGSSAAADPEIQGRVTDAVTGESLQGAVVTLTAVSGSAVLTDTADIFGRYAIKDVPPGDHTLAAAHGGYTPFSEARTLTSDQYDTRDIPLTPLIAGGGVSSSINIFVQVYDTSNMNPLAEVPMRVQRFDLSDSSTLLETITTVTDANGELTLNNKAKGWYTFRFNDIADGAIKPFYRKLDGGPMKKLETHHSAVAKLLPIKQDVTVSVTGPDPNDLDAGASPIKDVYIELLGVSPDFVPPAPPFDPIADDLRDYAVPIFPKIVGKTDATGSFVFNDLPPLGFIVTSIKAGYIAPQTLLLPSATGLLPSTHPHPVEVDPRTEISIIATSPYTTIDMMLGLGLVLKGLDGTATEGFERIEPLGPAPGGDSVTATIPMILPGRYQARVEGFALSPVTPASEDSMLSVSILYKGEAILAVGAGEAIEHTLALKPVPARIRGRLFAADERQTIALPSDAPTPFDLWDGPAFQPKSTMGIHFTQSVLGAYLPPGFDLVAVDTDPNGYFTATVLPGFWGVNIPLLDGYWGSNFRSKNHATGEVFALGWPYASDPAAPEGLPLHPFGSLGIPISSGDELEIDFFVRKQAYYVNGTVIVDTTSPALDRVIALASTALPVPAPPIIAPFSHLAATTTVTYAEDGAGGTPVPLDIGSSSSGSIITAGSGGGFRIAAPRGTHTVTLASTGGHHGFSAAGGPYTISLPDYGSPGEALLHPIIPLTDLGSTPGLPDPIISDYADEHSVLMRFHGVEDEAPILRFTRDKPEFAYHPALGTRLFRVAQDIPFRMMKGPWTIWVSSGDFWYSESFTLDGGSAATHVIDFDLQEEQGGSVVSFPPPLPSYKLTLIAENADDPTDTVPGFTATFEGGSLTTDASGKDSTAATYKGGYLPLSVTPPPGWLTPTDGSGVPTDYTIDTKAQGATPEVEIRIRLTRGSFIKGRLVLGPATTIPIEGVDVHLRDRFGRHLETLGTGTTDPGKGEFSVTLSKTPTLFVDVVVPGYKPFRMRKTPNEGDQTGTGPVDFQLGDLPLDPLPPPAFSMTLSSFDRKGIFIPGIRKSTPAGILVDDPVVTMTYGIPTTPPGPWPLTVPNYDSPNGDAAPVPPSPIMIEDTIKAIWIVDVTSFPDPPMGDPPYTVPDEGDPLYALKMGALLRRLIGVTATLPGGSTSAEINRFLRRHTDLGPTGMPASYIAAGTIDLASLPPGLFQPYIIAETQRGAFKHFQLKHENSNSTIEGYLNLFGMELPPWLAFLADSISTVGAVKAASEKLDRIIPEDLIGLLPDVSGGVDVNDGDELLEPSDFTLRYVYDLKASFAEGADVPASGLLGFAPGFAGFNLGGTLQFAVNGSSTDKSTMGIPQIKVVGEANTSVETKNFFDPCNYIPKSVPKSVGKVIKEEVNGTVNLSASARGNIMVTALEDLMIPKQNTTLTPLQRVLDMRTQGDVQVNVAVDVTRFAEAAPYIGQVLRFIRTATSKFRGGPYTPKVTLESRSTVGAAMQRKMTTRYAPPVAMTPDKWVDAADNRFPIRRNGLSEDFLPTPLPPEVTSDARICFGFQPGLRLTAGPVEAFGRLAVTGNDCTAKTSAKPIEALTVHLNEFGDWPPIKRITGDLTGSLGGSIDTGWFGKLRKEFTWNLIKIDVPFNTEEQFFLFPFAQQEEFLSHTTAPKASWCGTEPLLVDDFFLLSPYHVSTTGGSTLLGYVEVDAASSLMRLKVGLRTSGSTWAAPVEIASAAGIIDARIEELPTGGWLAVWSEVASADMDKTVTPTTLKYATSADGITWTAPALIAALTGTAFDLRLMPMPADAVGLVYLESEAGPGSAIVDLEAALFSGGTWGSITTLFDGAVIYGWDAAGPGTLGTVPAQIVAFTDVGGFVSVGWDGSSADPAVSLAAGPGLLCAIVAGPTDTYLAAYELPNVGVGFAHKSGADPWTILPSQPLVPLDFALTSVTGGASADFFFTWTQGGDHTDVGYLYMDSAGDVIAGPADVTPQPSPGFYHELQAVALPGGAVDILAQFEIDDDTGIRLFSTSEGAGLASKDTDSDTLDDLAELRIIDADPDDALRKLTDVLTGDDFDGDGSSNGAELIAGTDPTDALSFPGQLVVIEAIVDLADEMITQQGLFYVKRTGDVSTPLTVSYDVNGSATPDTDYTSLTGSVTIEAGLYAAPILVEALTDTEPEGDETVMVTLTTAAGYTLGTTITATVTIADLPLDAWRFSKFTPAELADPLISGLTADADGDELAVFLEYGFDADPKIPSVEDTPINSTVEDVSTGKDHPAMVYLRRKDDLELIYQVEVSDDLETWTPSTESTVEEISAIDNGDGTETVVVRHLTPLDSLTRLFMQVGLIRVAP